MAPAPRMTVDEYFRTPETTLPEELIYGAFRAADAPSTRHQAALRDVALALAAHLREHPVGQIWFAPVDVVLDREHHLVVQPDLVLVSTPNLPIVRDRIWGAPDLVVEVLSPFPRIGALDERLEWFARYRVRECWLLHEQEFRLEVLTFSDGRVAARASFGAYEPVRSRVLPEFDRSLSVILSDAIPRRPHRRPWRS